MTNTNVYIYFRLHKNNNQGGCRGNSHTNAVSVSYPLLNKLQKIAFSLAVKNAIFCFEFSFTVLLINFSLFTKRDLIQCFFFQYNLSLYGDASKPFDCSLSITLSSSFIQNFLKTFILPQYFTTVGLII